MGNVAVNLTSLALSMSVSRSMLNGVLDAQLMFSFMCCVYQTGGVRKLQGRTVMGHSHWKVEFCVSNIFQYHMPNTSESIMTLTKLHIVYI